MDKKSDDRPSQPDTKVTPAADTKGRIATMITIPLWIIAACNLCFVLVIIVILGFCLLFAANYQNHVQRQNMMLRGF